MGYKVTRATAVNPDGKFFMEILDGNKKIIPIEFVSRSEGSLKNWTIEDCMIVKDESGNEIIFRIHGNKGPVYLVTEMVLPNGKTKKFRVTFYTEGEVVEYRPKPKEPTEKKIISVNKSGKPLDKSVEIEEGYIPDYMKQPCHGPEEWKEWFKSYKGE